MNLEITKEELEAINAYKNEKYSNVNQLLSYDIESDISVLMSGENIQYSKNSVIENIELIKKIYEAMIKQWHSKNSKEDWKAFRIVNIAEINRLKAESNINRFLLATLNEEEAKSELQNNSSRQVIIQICADSEIPYIKVDENTNEIIVSPFVKATTVEEIAEESYDSNLRKYKMILENQELNILSEDEKEKIYSSILNNSDIVNQKLKECINLENENAINYENIRKLEQLLSKHNLAMEQENYDKDTTESEKQADLDDVSRINVELTSLKTTIAESFEKRNDNVLFISDWKKEVIKYLMSECRQIRDKYDNMFKSEEQKDEDISQDVEKQVITEVKLDPEVASAKAECKENIAMVNTLLTNIKNLIYKQQNHARIAELMDSNYKALNNAFEMKNFAEELDSLVKAISNKVDVLTAEDKEELSKISKTNIQVSTLMNYLNNPKSAVGKRITRFDEINILEENQLKREIAETIKNIRCEAELKKLRDDLDIIEDTNKFKKFIGRFTGRNKLNEAMIDQIQIRQTAIRKTFKAKMPLARNYSIHTLIAEIEMFINDNEDDELVMEDVSALRKIRDVLKKNFVIIDSRVISIIDQKTGKNLPFESRKLTKKELIEIDTYRFLNKYGYDKLIESDEPEYQDTLANEIKRIVDYIKTSEVL